MFTSVEDDSADGSILPMIMEELAQYLQYTSSAYVADQSIDSSILQNHIFKIRAVHS